MSTCDVGARNHKVELRLLNLESTHCRSEWDHAGIEELHEIGVDPFVRETSTGSRTVIEVEWTVVQHNSVTEHFSKSATVSLIAQAVP